MSRSAFENRFVPGRVAEISPSLHCVVLDLPEIVADGPSKILSDLQTRVTIAAHGFFQEPPEVVKGADVYLLPDLSQ